MISRLSIASLLCLLVLTLFFSPPALSQDPGNTVVVEDISFLGLKIWSPQNVRDVLEDQNLQAGKTYNEAELRRLVNKSIETLQDMGLFSDIQVRRSDNELIFKFEEFNRITNIKFKGNTIFDNSKLKDVLLLQIGDPANPFQLEQAKRDLVNFYHKEGYSSANVTYQKEVTPRGRVVLTYKIDEGTQLVINDVEYYYKPELTTLGEAYRNLNLKLILPMKPGKPYSQQIQKRSVRTIKQWYSTMGYLDASIDVKLWRNLQDGGIDVEFRIKQGPKYELGDIQLTGNELYSDTELKKLVPIKKDETFNVRLFQSGVSQIERKYRDRGYADVAVDFSLNRKKKRDPAQVDLDLQVIENKPVYVERIEIHGNFRTYDRVIRREIRLKPGGLLDGEKKRSSLRRLRNLGYFNEVKMNVDPGSRENWKIVRVKVTEGRTGQFQFGGGFSSSTGFTGNLSIRKDNFSLWDYSHGFTGRGQSIEASAQIGDRQSNFNISWDNPWFNDDLTDTSGPKPDVPLGFGWSIFNTTNDRDAGFNEIRSGGALRLSREFGPARSNQIDAEYSFNNTRVEDLDSADNTTSLDFLNELRFSDSSDSSFERTIASLEFGIQRDRRNNRLFPSDGYLLRLENRIAGEFLGGDINFLNPELDARYYRPFLGPTFWALRANYKTIRGYGGGRAGRAPSFEKFFLGGNRNVRGYDFRDIAVYGEPCPNIGTRTINDDDRCSGGNTAFFTNLELRFKLMKDTMQLFAFTDLGNVYRDSYDIGTEFKQSSGIGLRVRSPMGPINISWAKRMEPTYPDAPDAGETQIDFNIGTGF